ncbi:MAG: HAMP domain-containing histidine kinase [Planctomycetes bacterium]|nr:HAMP domain-containing histidine kinase [Planctomycetota bacterium]
MNGSGAEALAAERLPGLLGHELRNPLASAMTGAMLVREMVDGDDPRAAVLDGVLRDLDRMTRLVDGWLALARTGNPVRSTFAVDGLVRDVATRHDAEVVVSPVEPVLQGDRALLERALDNLCENARHAGARTIRIAVQRIGDQVAIHVEDDGRGVPAEHCERIFTPGWSSRGGAGLGLYAVATTVASHRGTVRCVPLARGTRFTLTLPSPRTRAALA